MTNMLFILRVHYFSIFLLIFFSISPPAAYASETIGTIQSSPAYAWGEKLSWINFKPTTASITITDSGISGYAWSQNGGWINFSPTNGGVTNTSSGQLGGYAWSSGMGWVSFSGVNISSLGKFTGIAGTLGSTAGRISFDCTNCDVKTDWRPLSARSGSTAADAIISRVVGGSVASALHAQPVPLFPTLGESPVILEPRQDGTIIHDTEVGPVIVSVPGKAVTQKLSLHIETEETGFSKIAPPVPNAVILNATFYEIVARDSRGNEIHEFDAPIRVTLPLPNDIRNFRRLAVYWLNEATQTWIKIPDAIFFDDHVVFNVTHLTRFAIFATRSSTIITMPAIIQGPGGGAIITEQKTVDISLQEKSIRYQKEKAQRSSGRTASPGVIPPDESPRGVGMNTLVVITATLIALLAHFLARRKLDETK